MVYCSKTESKQACKAGSCTSGITGYRGVAGIFVIPARGGEAIRLSYHSTGEYPSTFTTDNDEVLFSAVWREALQKGLPILPGRKEASDSVRSNVCE
jgi:hypothetical protein